MLKLSDKNFKAVDTIMLNDISENMLAINEKNRMFHLRNRKY